MLLLLRTTQGVTIISKMIKEVSKKEIKVNLIDHMGGDSSIVRSARVSFANDKSTSNFPINEKDERLIKFLARHGHWTPFAHTCLTFYVQAPIFVARQLGKHQVGLVWNEVSRRYIDHEPDTYYFSEWRERALDKKQGSKETPIENQKASEASAIFEFIDRLSTDAYNRLLSIDVCPEQARSVLPMATMTRWYWTGSLYAFSRVCNLRLHGTSQKETAEVAKQISDICSDQFPVSWKALSEQWLTPPPPLAA